MEILDFSHNWNNKLDCMAYTTLRLRNDQKYYPGAEFSVTFKRKEHHHARVVEVRHLTVNRINEFIARLDTGYSATECVKLIHTMYKNIVKDWDTQELSLILMERIKENNADKIGMFCAFYERATGLKYKTSAAESGMIKKVQVTEELLKAYFESQLWWATIKSITYYCKNINEIRRIAVQGSASQFPNSWSKKYEDKLDNDTRSKYWAHLRLLGWTPKKHPQLGHVIDWVKVDQQKAAE